eukprot:g648.t1
MALVVANRADLFIVVVSFCVVGEGEEDVRDAQDDDAGEEVVGGEEDEGGEEDDDTAAPITVARVDDALPVGFMVEEHCPPIDNSLIGRRVLFKWDAHGWCAGKIKRAVTAQKEKDKGLNFVVHYEGDRDPFTQALVASSYGRGSDWLLLTDVSGGGGSSAASAGGGDGGGSSRSA